MITDFARSAEDGIKRKHAQQTIPLPFFRTHINTVVREECQSSSAVSPVAPTRTLPPDANKDTHMNGPPLQGKVEDMFLCTAHADRKLAKPTGGRRERQKTKPGKVRKVAGRRCGSKGPTKSGIGRPLSLSLSRTRSSNYRADFVLLISDPKTNTPTCWQH